MYVTIYVNKPTTTIYNNLPQNWSVYNVMTPTSRHPHPTPEFVWSRLRCDWTIQIYWLTNIDWTDLSPSWPLDTCSKYSHLTCVFRSINGILMPEWHGVSTYTAVPTLYLLLIYGKASVTRDIMILHIPKGKNQNTFFSSGSCFSAIWVLVGLTLTGFEPCPWTPKAV